ncbi:unnamed protein product, partial [Nesidiocoris tenuis]
MVSLSVIIFVSDSKISELFCGFRPAESLGGGGEHGIFLTASYQEEEEEKEEEEKQKKNNSTISLARVLR